MGHGPAIRHPANSSTNCMSHRLLATTFQFGMTATRRSCIFSYVGDDSRLCPLALCLSQRPPSLSSTPALLLLLLLPPLLLPLLLLLQSLLSALLSLFIPITTSSTSLIAKIIFHFHHTLLTFFHCSPKSLSWLDHPFFCVCAFSKFLSTIIDRARVASCTHLKVFLVSVGARQSLASTRMGKPEANKCTFQQRLAEKAASPGVGKSNT